MFKHHLFARSILCVALLASIGAGSAGAASISASATANAGGVPCNTSQNGPLQASCSVSNNTYGSQFAGASAQADYGSLHVFASTLQSGSASQFVDASSSSAQASAQDRFVVVNGPPQGFIRFEFVISGTQAFTLTNISPLGQTNDDLNTELLMLADQNYILLSLRYNLGIVSQTVFFDLPFSNGLVSETLLFSSLTRCISGGGVDPNATLSCNAAGDFSHTLSIAGLGVLDSNHQQVVGASLLADSGFNYPTLAAAQVPEPSTLSLVGGFLCILLGSSRRPSTPPARSNRQCRPYPSAP